MLKQLVLSSEIRFHKFCTCQPYKEEAKVREIFHAFLRSQLQWWLELQALLQVSPVSFPSEEAIPNLDTSLTQPCSPEHPHQVTQPFQHHLCPWSGKTHGLLIAPKCIFCPPLCLHHTALLWSLSVSHAMLLHTHTVFDTDFGETGKESQWTWADRKELNFLFLDPRTAAESLLCI